jgi:hypothetical protein
VGVEITALVGGAVGGAAVQSVLGPLFGQIHERRELRAKALDSVAEVERERWASSDDRSAFRSAIVRLRSNALVAGVNRTLLDMYVLAAAAAYGQSLADWEMSGDSETGGSISIPLASYAKECAAALSFQVWHPRWSFARRPITIRRLRTEKAHAIIHTHRGEDQPVDWDRVWVPG